MGPGVVSGAADNAPSGVITYVQIGATTGFSLLWLMLLSTPTAAALRPVAGSASTALFAVGIVTSGVLSVPVMAACSAYGLCEIFDWREGLGRTVGQARGFYVLLSASLVAAVAIGLLRIPPVALMFWSQVLNGIVLAPLVAVLTLRSNDPRVVRTYRSHPLSTAVGWGTVALTVALAALTVGQLVAGS